MAEEYKSVHTGPQIDEAVRRALPSGSIDEALSKKVNWSLRSINEGSLKEWAEAQSAPTSVSVAPGVTDTPYASYWHINLDISTGGSWMFLTARLAGVSTTYSEVYRRACINNTWGDWVGPIATATPPTEYALPLASDLDVTSKYTCSYWKNQFGEVTVLFNIKATIVAGKSNNIFILPSGFRPKNFISFPVVTKSGQAIKAEFNTSGYIYVEAQNFSGNVEDWMSGCIIFVAGN